MTISILLVDDHPVFLFGLRMLIEAEPDLRIVGEAMSGAEALHRLASLQLVDLVIMDIGLPDMNGVEVTRRIRQAHPKLPILILTMLDDNTVFTALKAGANGYILKGAGGDETLRAIRAIAGGEAIFSPSIARRLVQHFDRAPVSEPFPELTEREREILVLLAQGLTNTAIAEALSLSVKTVRNRISDIFSKLHVSDRAEAIIKARNAGLGSS
jgi:DNA-binding NarL/FixJ family response regulator